MRRRRLLTLVVSSVALGLGAGPAMADGSVSGQLAQQVAGNQQSAQSGATSTQYAPSNSNISVRVLSPGNNGSVTQSNSSSAESFAGNANATAQAVEQLQGGGGGTGIQEAGQAAGNQQSAQSHAESTQVAPQNRNISVRVLSPGNDGEVTQSNDSSAESKAGNLNELGQSVRQHQAGSDCRCHGSLGIQAAGQEAYSKQNAESSAESKQVKPENKNLSVRVLSPGNDGRVTQSNESHADSKALNKNDTTQGIEQAQAGSGCKCHDSLGIQAAGQKALNWQDAKSHAESKQFYPSNKSMSVRFKSPGYGGKLTQSNASHAGSYAANWNALDQALSQTQGTPLRV